MYSGLHIVGHTCMLERGRAKNRRRPWTKDRQFYISIFQQGSMLNHENRVCTDQSSPQTVAVQETKYPTKAWLHAGPNSSGRKASKMEAVKIG